MAIILDGTFGETFPSWTTAGRPTSLTTGQTGYNTTIGALETYNGSSWLGSPYVLPTPGTSGNYLTSNGSAWTSTAAPTYTSYTLLSTVPTTAGSSITVTGTSSLLSGYLIAYLVFTNVTVGTNKTLYIRGTGNPIFTTGPTGGIGSGIVINDRTTGLAYGYGDAATSGSGGLINTMSAFQGYSTFSGANINISTNGTFTSGYMNIYGVK